MAAVFFVSQKKLPSWARNFIFVKIMTIKDLTVALATVSNGGDLAFDDVKSLKTKAEIYIGLLTAVEAVEAMKKTLGPILLKEDDAKLLELGIKVVPQYQFDDSGCPLIQADVKAVEKATKALNRVMASPEVAALVKASEDAQKAIDDHPKVIKARAGLAAAQTTLSAHKTDSEKEIKKLIAGKEYNHDYDGMTYSLKKKDLRRAK